LQRDPQDIIGDMRPTARSNIRKAVRKGVTVRAAGTAGLPAFGRLLRETSRRQRFSPYPLEYYADILALFGERGHAELLLAQRGDSVLSGALIVGYGDTAVYKMGAWSGERTNVHPNELMHWRAMEWARERGYRYYDLEGISESVARATPSGQRQPARGRHGTTHFKLGMGGEVAFYPRAYDRSFHPFVWSARLLAPRLTRFRSIANRLVGREHVEA
jgi:lipid II:glycine glycyltransferase (peptidoglycan interpeptide bridge formation enzyme)